MHQIAFISAAFRSTSEVGVIICYYLHELSSEVQFIMRIETVLFFIHCML